MFYYLAKAIYRCRSLRARDIDGEKNEQEERFQKYRNTLLELMKVKLHSDHENSIQDGFSKLKQDLQNHFAEKQKKTEAKLALVERNVKEAIQKTEPVDLKTSEVEGLRAEMKEVKELLKIVLSHNEALLSSKKEEEKEN